MTESKKYSQAGKLIIEIDPKTIVDLIYTENDASLDSHRIDFWFKVPNAFFWVDSSQLCTLWI